MLTMSSEANREYVKDTVSYYVGDDVVVKSSDGKDNVVRGVSEAEMRADIKEKLNIEVPIFRYLPEEMKLVKYEIYDKDKMALVYYTIEDTKVTLAISGKYDDKQNIKIYDGDKIDIISDRYNEFFINIFENVDKNSGLEVYSAKWERKSVIYRFSGMKKKQEFYKILKKMTF